MIKPYTIKEGFFAGCTVYEDDELPPDTIKYIDGSGTYSGNIRTGEMSFKACSEDDPVALPNTAS